jgi:hypothetical protein
MPENKRHSHSLGNRETFIGSQMPHLVMALKASHYFLPNGKVCVHDEVVVGFR